MGGGFPAGRATGVQADRRDVGCTLRRLQFDEDAAHFLDLLVGTNQVLVAQQVSESQLSSLRLRFHPSMEVSVFGSHLLCRVASHPESLFVSHTYLAPGSRSLAMDNERSIASSQSAIVIPHSEAGKNQYFRHVQPALDYGKSLCGCNNLQKLAA